jgi:hypothetical protein
LSSDQLDILWNAWTSQMSRSYAETLDLIEQDKSVEAADTFTRSFSSCVKRIYAEAAKTAPKRFSEYDGWATWASDLYIATRKAEVALGAKQTDLALPPLADLRKRFHALHEESGTLGANDHIYAFHAAAGAESPSADDLKAILAQLEEARPSVKAKAEPEAYAQAKAAWLGKISPALEDGQLDDTELGSLRESTQGFYRAYGMAFE